VGGIKSAFLWALGFPVIRRKIARKVVSSMWVALDYGLNVVGENCLLGSEGPLQTIFVEGECLVIQCDFQQGVSDSKSNSGIEVEARQLKITPQALL